MQGQKLISKGIYLPIYNHQAKLATSMNHLGSDLPRSEALVKKEEILGDSFSYERTSVVDLPDCSTSQVNLVITSVARGYRIQRTEPIQRDLKIQKFRIQTSAFSVHWDNHTQCKIDYLYMYK